MGGEKWRGSTEKPRQCLSPERQLSVKDDAHQAVVLLDVNRPVAAIAVGATGCPRGHPCRAAPPSPILLTLAAICAGIIGGEHPWWIGWGSLLLAATGFLSTMIRTVPNARRLGSGKGL